MSLVHPSAGSHKAPVGQAADSPRSSRSGSGDEYTETSLLNMSLIDHSLMTVEDVTDVGSSGKKVVRHRQTSAKRTWVQQARLDTRNVLQYILHDAKKNKTQSCISVCGLFVIIGSLSIILSIWALLPVIFTRTIENSVGEFDFLILGSGAALSELSDLSKKADNMTGMASKTFTDSLLLNRSYIQEVLEKISYDGYTFDTLRHPETSKSQGNGLGNAFSRLVIPANCSKTPQNRNAIVPGMIFIADTKRESDFQLGTGMKGYFLNDTKKQVQYINHAVLQNKQVLVSQEVYSSLQLSQQTKIVLEVNPIQMLLSKVLGGVGGNVNTSSFTPEEKEKLYQTLKKYAVELGVPEELLPSIEDVSSLEFPTSFPSISVEFEIVGVVTRSGGKWPSIFSNGILMDYKSLDTILQKAIDTVEDILTDPSLIIFWQVAKQQIHFLSDVSGASEWFSDYSPLLLVKLNNKEQVYSTPRLSVTRLNRLLNRFAAELDSPNNFQLVSPTLQLLSGLSMLGYFVQNIFLCLVFLFLFLGYYLYQGLTLLSVQASLENHRIIRSLGVTQNFVRIVSVAQPSILGFIGIISAIVSNWIGVWAVSGLLMTIFPGHTIACAARFEYEIPLLLVAGIGVSLISTQSTLSSHASKIGSSLGGSSSNQSDDVEVKVERKDRGVPFSYPSLMLGLQLAAIGFTFYYLAPQAFFKGRMDIFLLCLTSVLLLGITHLSLLSTAYIQPFVEKLLIKVISVSDSGKLLTVLDGDRELSPIRNGLRAIWTVIGFTVCFVIFSGTGIESQIHAVKTVVHGFQGSDLVIQKSDSPFSPVSLPQERLNEMLRKEPYSAIISGMSFQSVDLRDYLPRLKFATPGEISSFSVSVYGIERNFLNSTDAQFYTADKVLHEEVPWPAGSELESIFKEEPTFDEVFDPNDYQSGLKKAIYPDRQMIRGVYPIGLENMISRELGSINFLRTGYAPPLRIKLTVGSSGMPGTGFSAYPSISSINPTIIVSMKSAAYILNTTKVQFNESIPLDGVPKQRMFVKLRDESAYNAGKTGLAYSTARALVKSAIRQTLSDEDTIFDIDALSESLGVLTEGLAWVNTISCLLFLLLATMLLVVGVARTLTSSASYLGILRSIGISGSVLASVFRLQVGVGTLSSLSTGLTSGLFVAVLSAVASSIFFESPMNFRLPLRELMWLALGLMLGVGVVLFSASHRIRGGLVARMVKGKL